MTRASPRGARRLWAGLALFAFSADPAAGASFTPLGDLSGGTVYSLGKAVSADGGVAVGWSVGASGLEAFRWTDSSGLQGLGDLPGGAFSSAARSVSADGLVIVGDSKSAPSPALREAFRWTALQGLVPLGHLAGGGSDSVARAASGDGAIVVGQSDSLLGLQAFRWTQLSGLEGLGDLPGGAFESSAIGISADGSTLVGFGVANAGREACLWTASGAPSIQSLGELPGGLHFSAAEDVSQDGSVIVGYSESADGPEAFLWTQATGIQGLGDLPGGPFDSLAWDVSDDGRVVVGQSETGAGREAFLWDADNGMQNLRVVLEDHFGLDLGGFVPTAARGASADGSTIVGNGTNASGDTEAFVAVLDVGCSDGIDNDGDGYVDHPEDPGCSAPDDWLEIDPLLPCDDGIDNDGDGRIDFDPATLADPGDDTTPPSGEGDPGCLNPTWSLENPQCQDGDDDDGDGRIDYDAGLSANGQADPGGPDPQCSGAPWKLKERSRQCGLGFELALLLPLLLGWRRRSRRISAAAILSGGLIALAGASFSPSARAASFTSLGDLPGGQFFSTARKVSLDGSTVSGDSLGTSGPTNPGTLEAFRWRGAGLEPLGGVPGHVSNSATGLSADGSVICGQSRPDVTFTTSEAFRWTESGGMAAMGFLPGGGSDSKCNAVSADGSLAIGRSDSSEGTQAFLWTEPGGMVGLGDLPGGGFDSRAIGISADGSIIAGRGESAAGVEAYRWTAATGMQGLGELPGGGFFSMAEAISADGDTLVGFSESDAGMQAFRWTAAGGMQGLGDLPGGDFESRAFSISADGKVIVGFSRSALGREGFLWDVHNGMHGLKDVLEAEFALDLTGYTLEFAWGLSGDGRTIAGQAVNPAGDTEGFVAVLDVGCADGIDNDGDGAVDHPDDLGCAAPDDLLETAPGLPCDDGIDNDGDGRVDHDPVTAASPGDPSTPPAGTGDPACGAAGFPSETSACHNGLDDDGEGLIDYDGGRSLDLDADGFVDAAFNPATPALTAADPECQGLPWRGSESPRRCGLGFELAAIVPLLRALAGRRRRRCTALPDGIGLA